MAINTPFESGGAPRADPARYILDGSEQDLQRPESVAVPSAEPLARALRQIGVADGCKAADRGWGRPARLRQRRFPAAMAVCISLVLAVATLLISFALSRGLAPAPRGYGAGTPTVPHPAPGPFGS